MFMQFLKDAINSLDTYVKYLKAKGWLEVPPLYKNVPPEVDEILDTGEAFHLWDYLTFRYDNLFKTQLFYGYAYDGDFKTLLLTGTKILEGQCKKLLGELTYFGIPVPKRPSKTLQPF